MNKKLVTRHYCPQNSCGGQGCSTDPFTLPFAGGRRRVTPRRLRIKSRSSHKNTFPDLNSNLFIPVQIFG